MGSVNWPDLPAIGALVGVVELVETVAGLQLRHSTMGSVKASSCPDACQT